MSTSLQNANENRQIIMPCDENSLNSIHQCHSKTRKSCIVRVFSKLCSCFIVRHKASSEEITLLPPHNIQGKKTLILDLDETLVHSSLQPIEKCDLKLTITIDTNLVDIYVLIRPGAEDFLINMGKLFEVVIFTASLKAYADPVIDFIDKHHVVKSRLFRNDCINSNGSYIKNLSLLGRDLKKVIIVDNSPMSYSMHPYNALAITSWFDDKNDIKLQEVHKILEILDQVDDVTEVLRRLGTENLELSPKNINLIMDNYLYERSELNSPKPGNAKQFEFSKAAADNN
ncbi:hypothetical protein SteCoe_22147 [Stentor coeruleus]|uniref:FCP1 homology domain-containing protein n=1 Tax=Stentor coeruleus TaxID=5963 RepID=A0A1R2BMY8_9CILI|nr:hypothetical protein SteCoe_22147 [Stentor coeruleus]